MKIKKLVVVTAMSMALMVPMEALAASATESQIYVEYEIQPRYAHTGSANLSVSASKITVSVTGNVDVTSITGTAIVYKVAANGKKTKVTSWNASTKGRFLRSGKSVNLGTGNYVAEYNGTVKTNTTATEKVKLESKFTIQ